VTITLYLSVFAMNYIKQLQADKAEAFGSARSIEAAINHLISVCHALSFTSIRGYRVGDVLRDLLPIRNDVTHMATTLSYRGTNGKNI
jgi:hypothetical protein